MSNEVVFVELASAAVVVSSRAREYDLSLFSFLGEGDVGNE